MDGEVKLEVMYLCLINQLKMKEPDMKVRK